MPLTTQQIHEVAVQLGTHLFVRPNATATLSVTHLRSIAAKIDEGMAATGAVINAAYPGVAFEAALVLHVKTAVPAATGQQVAMGVALWAMKRGGLT